MAIKKTAAKGLAEMSKSQRAMIANIDEITDWVVAKVGWVKTADKRQEIVEAVASKYLPGMVRLVKQHLSIPDAGHQKLAKSVLAQVAKQFSAKVAA
jgi:hypothetical protein